MCYALWHAWDRDKALKLVNVYRLKRAPEIMYELLRERSTEHDRFVNISHRKLPTWRAHLAFIRKRPYRAWYLIRERDDYAGTLYLSKAGEIGIVLFRAFRGKGIGPKAIAALMKRHKSARFIANINPKNKRSIALFKKLGFSLLQHTYELRK